MIRKTKNTTVTTVLKSKTKTWKEVKSIPLTHKCSLSWLGTDISIKSGGVKLVLWAQT
jgi:hypothetical protein